VDHGLRPQRAHLRRDRRFAARYNAFCHWPRKVGARLAIYFPPAVGIRGASSRRFIEFQSAIGFELAQPKVHRVRTVKLSPCSDFGFSVSELRTLRALKTPAGVQRFLDDLPYNLRLDARSPRNVLYHGTASCLDGGIFAAAALRVLGFPPLIFDLEADRDTDHVVAIYKVGGHWGAVAKSNFTGCRSREPVYRNLRELALSYFHGYFNLRFERTLRRYSRPVNLGRFDDRAWMTTEKPIWFIAEYLLDIPHIPLLPPGAEKRLTRVDRRTVRAEMVGHRKNR
jgi:hypothetical protein